MTPPATAQPPDDTAGHADVTTVLVPGVGLWPGSLASLADHLPGPTTIWVRAGYGDRPDVTNFADRVSDILTAIETHAPARVVGVSGGATLALACAVARPDGLVGIVTHEPLVGSLAPSLHCRVVSAGASLQAEPSVEAAEGFLKGLFGADGWSAVGEEGRRWAQDHHRIVCREVSHFAAFAPTTEELEAIEVDHVTTIGGDSGPDRREVADLLAAAGATVVTVADTGHLAPIEAPDSYARALSATQESRP